MNEFGELLKKSRGKMSLRETAKKIGISHTYLASLENDCDPRSGKTRMPSIETLRKVSKIYGIPFIELLIKINYITKQELKDYFYGGNK